MRKVVGYNIIRWHIMQRKLALQRTARKMPSADLTKSEFKYKGVLKVDGEIGDIVSCVV